jgi:hypothetical protein
MVMSDRELLELDCLKCTKDDLIDKIIYERKLHNESIAAAASMIRDLNNQLDLYKGSRNDVVQLLKDCKQEFKESCDDVKHERIAYMNNYRSLIKRINKVLYNDI